MPCQFCLETRKKVMRLFGFSIPLFVLLFVAFYLGAKNPALLGKIPLINKL